MAEENNPDQMEVDPPNPPNRPRDLPPEVLADIIGQLDPDDIETLRTLTHANATTREFALRHLREEFVVREGTPLPSLTPAGPLLQNMRDPALQFIRHLKVERVDNNPARVGNAEELQFVQCLLQVIRPNYLRTLDLATLTVDYFTFLMIVTRQQNLRKLYLGTLNFDSSALTGPGFPAGTKLWSNLQVLSIPRRVDHEQNLGAYGSIIRQAQGLRQLFLDTNDPLRFPQSTRFLNADDARPGALFPGLLSHIPNGHPSHMLRLELLSLESVSVYLPDRYLTARIDFSRLTTLELLGNCPGTTQLLGELTRIARRGPFALRNFKLDVQADADGDLDKALNGFLRSFGGLRVLHIQADTFFHDFEVISLYTHLQTLEQLEFKVEHLCDHSPENRKYIQPLFRIVSRCPQMRRLAIPLPAFNLVNYNHAILQQWNEAILLLFQLRHLRTLAIMNPPNPGPNILVDPGHPAHLTPFTRISRSYCGWAHNFLTMMFRRLAAAQPWIMDRGSPLICFGGEACDGNQHWAGFDYVWRLARNPNTGQVYVRRVTEPENLGPWPGMWNYDVRGDVPRTN